VRHAPSCLVLAALTTTGRAAADPARQAAELDEQRARGAIDIERLPALPRSSEPASSLKMPLSLSLLAWRNSREQSTELGIGAIVSLPLDVLARGPRLAAPMEASFVPVAATSAPRAPFEIVDDVRLAPGDVRRLVRAAWDAAGLSLDETRLTDLASRARTSATLPELRLRVVRTVDESLRLSPTLDEPDRTLGGAGVAMHYEARATWRLDRLVFADDEVALERMRLERNAERMRLTLHLLEVLTTWQRAHARALDPTLPAYERADAAVREVAASTALDALTDGAWSKREER
jgi:hypothetical protein